jgi:hypothetical protein
VVTAIDTSVLLDVFAADPRCGNRPRTAVRRGLNEGSLIACEVVFAEVAASFPTARAAGDAMDGLHVKSPLSIGESRWLRGMRGESTGGVAADGSV